SSNYEWVGLDDTLATTVIGRWMHKNIRDTQIGLRVDALPALKDAACAGMGMALLPCYLGDEEVRLRRVPEAAGPDIRSALWLLTHSDLKRTARVRAVMDFLGSALSSERALLEGRRHRKAVPGSGSAATGHRKAK